MLVGVIVVSTIAGIASGIAALAFGLNVWIALLIYSASGTAVFALMLALVALRVALCRASLRRATARSAAPQPHPVRHRVTSR